MFIVYYFGMIIVEFKIDIKHTRCRGTAGILLVLARCCFSGRLRHIPGGAGLVGLGLKCCDVDDTKQGLILVGLLGDGDKCPHGPASACKNLLI